MQITIDPYDSKSIENAIKQVKEYKTYIQTKEKQLVERLADIGVNRATVFFNQAIYDGYNDVTVTAKIEGNVAHIIANGESVAFIEFGTGIKMGNGYLGTRPTNIVGIGEYGKKQGKNPKGWLYPLENGLGTNGQISTIKPSLAHTYGNPPNMALYKTMLELQVQIEQVAREVFGNDR